MINKIMLKNTLRQIEELAEKFNRKKVTGHFGFQWNFNKGGMTKPIKYTKETIEEKNN